jgi:DNA ligase (NAD+)
MARIEPTLLDGSTISNITLHNAANVEEMDVAVGDEVLVFKAGDVIPQIGRVVSRTNRKVVHISDKDASVYPETCPSCNDTVEYDEKEVNLWCKNPACPAKLEERILHYVKTLDILGVGSGIVSGLCKAGYVKDLPDLYYLSQEQVVEVTGGTRAAEKVITAILEKNQIPLAVFLDALGIDGLGTTTSKDVAKKYKKLDVIRNIPVIPAWLEDLTSIEGIGELTAKKIVNGLIVMAPTITALVKCIDILDVQDTKGPLVGMSFCITGALSKPRKEIEKLIEECGGECKSSVGKGLDFLIQADASSMSSKSEKAKKFGTKIMDEATLWNMMGK